MFDWLRSMVGRKGYTDGENAYVTLVQQEQQAYDLSRYPWLGEFDIASDDDQNKIRRIRELLSQGQGFKVFKATSDNYGRATKHLAQIAFFPTSDDVWDLVGPTWGGGTYNITSQIRPQWVIHSYTFDAPSKQPKRQREEDTDPTQSAKERLIANGLKALENDPEAYNMLLMGMLGKEFGVSMPKKAGKESLDDELIRELAEEDPDFKRELTEKAVAARYGGKKEKDTLTEFLKVKKQLDELGLGKEPEKKTSVVDIVGGIVKEGVSALRDPGVMDGVARVVESAKQQPQSPPPIVTVDRTVNTPPLRLAEQQQVPIQHPNGNQPLNPLNPPAPTSTDASTLSEGWTDEQWMSLMTGVDLGVLSKAVDQDAEVFIQGLYQLAVEEEDATAIQLIGLLRDTSAAALYAQICNDTLPALKGEEWKGKITLFLGEETYGKAVELLEKMSTEKGKKWLEVANATCRFLDARIANNSRGQGVQEGMGASVSIDDGDDGPLI